MAQPPVYTAELDVTTLGAHDDRRRPTGQAARHKRATCAGFTHGVSTLRSILFDTRAGVGTSAGTPSMFPTPRSPIKSCSLCSLNGLRPFFCKL